MTKDMLKQLDELMQQHLEIGLSLEGGLSPELINDILEMEIPEERFECICQVQHCQDAGKSQCEYCEWRQFYADAWTPW